MPSFPTNCYFNIGEVRSISIRGRGGGDPGRGGGGTWLIYQDPLCDFDFELEGNRGSYRDRVVSDRGRGSSSGGRGGGLAAREHPDLLHIYDG